jgi:hypothetical protein
MDENWSALCISILKNIPPEQAFLLLEGNVQKKRKLNPTITDEDIEDMIRLRESHTYREIGEMYGLEYHAVFKRIKRYLIKKSTKSKEVTSNASKSN